MNVIKKRFHLIWNIFGKHFTADSFNPFHHFLLLPGITFHVTMSHIIRRIIKLKSISAIIIINIRLKRSAYTAHRIISMPVIEIHPDNIFLLPVRVSFIQYHILFRLDSSPLPDRNIHKRKEMLRNTQYLNLNP